MDENPASTMRYQAGPAANLDTIRVELSETDELTLDLTIIEPVVVFHQPRAGAAQFHDNVGKFSYSGFARVELHPNTVNFDAVAGYESQVNPILNGYFAEDPNAYIPHGANGPHDFRFLENPYGNYLYNPATGQPRHDMIGHHTHGRPYNQNGTFSWPIEWTYTIDIGVHRPMGPAHQNAQIQMGVVDDEITATYVVEKATVKMGTATKVNPNNLQ